MKRAASFIACLLLLCALASAQATRPVPAIERVLIISVDGMRPDLALRANTPALHSLIQRGSFSFWARTIPMAITLPSHASMLTGVPVEKHKITWNDDLPADKIVYSAAPTLFELAKKAGYSTSLVSGKSKFISLAKPGTVDFPAIASAKDNLVADHAIDIITKNKPQVLFIHFADNDVTGHALGWGSPQQIATLEKADECIGRVLKTLADQKLTDSTLIIVSADHGGQGRVHGPDDPRSRHIPWIAAGPGIRANYDLTLDAKLVINTEDTFATACYFLAIPYPDSVEGKPITQIIAKTELLEDVKPATKPARFPGRAIP